MSLRYSDKPQYGQGSKSDDWRGRFPQDARPIATAPITSQPIIVYTPDGQGRGALHHNNSWRELKPFTDFRDRSVSWRMDQMISNPVAWAMPRRK
jgi:hypothetical protein